MTEYDLQQYEKTVWRTDPFSGYPEQAPNPFQRLVDEIRYCWKQIEYLKKLKREHITSGD